MGATGPQPTASAEAEPADATKQDAPAETKNEAQENATTADGWVWTEQGITFMKEANKHEEFGGPSAGDVVTAENKQKLEQMGIWTAVIDREVIARDGNRGDEGEE